ncbi:MAG: hypothetical protein J0G32_01375 [Alphaproteobacteria bacterium]|nr:hypothetical protein [Alphaproteobacteria bacterium]OJV13182.1 MAG: hypothetical protein BGO27_00055 [Alphaproteobacteria bacterium 33-17]
MTKLSWHYSKHNPNELKNYTDFRDIKNSVDPDLSPIGYNILLKNIFNTPQFDTIKTTLLTAYPSQSKFRQKLEASDNSRNSLIYRIINTYAYSHLEFKDDSDEAGYAANDFSSVQIDLDALINTIKANIVDTTIGEKPTLSNQEYRNYLNSIYTDQFDAIKTALLAAYPAESRFKQKLEASDNSHNSLIYKIVNAYAANHIAFKANFDENAFLENQYSAIELDIPGLINTTTTNVIDTTIGAKPKLDDIDVVDRTPNKWFNPNHANDWYALGKQLGLSIIGYNILPITRAIVSSALNIFGVGHYVSEGLFLATRNKYVLKAFLALSPKLANLIDFTINHFAGMCFGYVFGGLWAKSEFKWQKAETWAASSNSLVSYAGKALQLITKGEGKSQLAVNANVKEKFLETLNAPIEQISLITNGIVSKDELNYTKDEAFRTFGRALSDATNPSQYDDYFKISYREAVLPISTERYIELTF